MKTYLCGSLRPIKVTEDTWYELGGRDFCVKDAARIFANRLAKRHFGKSGYCHHVRLDTYREDGSSYNYEAFIGRDVSQKYGGGCSGHNIWLTIYTKGE